MNPSPTWELESENTLVLVTPYSEQFYCTFLCNDDYDKKALCYITPIFQNPSMPLSIGREMDWYDEKNNYYWRYVISDIITIIGLNIICKLTVLFDNNFPLKYYCYIECKQYSIPLWYINSNSLIDPIADNGLYEIGDNNFDYTYCIIKRMDFRSEDSCILYCIRPLTDIEENNLDKNQIVPIIHIMNVKNNVELESLNNWKKQFTNKKGRIVEEYEEKSSNNLDLVCEESVDPTIADPTPVDPTSVDPTFADPTSVDPTPLDVLLVHESDSSEEETFSETTNESSDSSIIEELTTEILEEILKKVVEKLSLSETLKKVKHVLFEQDIPIHIEKNIIPKVKKIRIRNRVKKPIVTEIKSEIVLSIPEKIDVKDDFYSDDTKYVDTSLIIDNIIIKNQKGCIYDHIKKNTENVNIGKENKEIKIKKTKKIVKQNDKSIDLNKSKKDDIILYITSEFETLFSKVISLNNLNKSEIYDKYVLYTLSSVNNDLEIKNKDIYLKDVKTYILKEYPKLIENISATDSLQTVKNISNQQSLTISVKDEAKFNSSSVRTLEEPLFKYKF